MKKNIVFLLLSSQSLSERPLRYCPVQFVAQSLAGDSARKHVGEEHQHWHGAQPDTKL